jgi:hypothetical protein
VLRRRARNYRHRRRHGLASYADRRRPPERHLLSRQWGGRRRRGVLCSRDAARLRRRGPSPGPNRDTRPVHCGDTASPLEACRRLQARTAAGYALRAALGSAPLAKLQRRKLAEGVARRIAQHSGVSPVMLCYAVLCYRRGARRGGGRRVWRGSGTRCCVRWRSCARARACRGGKPPLSTPSHGTHSVWSRRQHCSHLRLGRAGSGPAATRAAAVRGPGLSTASGRRHAPTTTACCMA